MGLENNSVYNTCSNSCSNECSQWAVTLDQKKNAVHCSLRLYPNENLTVNGIHTSTRIGLVECYLATKSMTLGTLKTTKLAEFLLVKDLTKETKIKIIAEGALERASLEQYDYHVVQISNGQILDLLKFENTQLSSTRIVTIPDSPHNVEIKVGTPQAGTIAVILSPKV